MSGVIFDPENCLIRGRRRPFDPRVLRQKEGFVPATVTSRTRLWLASGWECRGRRLSQSVLEAGSVDALYVLCRLTRCGPAGRSFCLVSNEQESFGRSVSFEIFKARYSSRCLARLHLDFAESEADLELVAYEAVPR
jgi:hypothetical protein